MAIAVQARAGLAIAGLAPAGYFVPNVVFLINGVDRSAGYVHFPSLSITLAINDEPDECSFSIVSRSGLVPVAGQTVLIGLGDSNNLIFGGQIATVEHQYEADGEPTPWIDITCTDWSALANRRLITADFSGLTVSQIAALIAGYTSGFTVKSLSTSLSTVIEEFICINEYPMTAMRRLVNLIGGGCYIDPHRDWHVWGPGGETGYYAPTPPETLTGGLSTLKKFRHGYDDTQKRTRVIVEGRSGQVMVPIPASADLGTYGIPLDDNAGWIFNPSIDSELNYARIGAMVVAYQAVFLHPGPPAAVLAADASPGDTTVDLVDYGTLAFQVGWLTDGNGNYFAARAYAGVPPPYQVVSIPTAGYGSIQTKTGEPIPAGTPLYLVHHLEAVAALTPSTAVEHDIEAGEPVVVRVAKNDAAAQAVIAAIEGGDGIHEYPVSDGNLTYLGCSQRADAELDTFGATLPYAEWETQDLNAGVGGQQVINVTQTGGISVTVTIQRVTLNFPEPAMVTNAGSWPLSFIGLPRRVCQGGTVKLQGLFEEIRG